MNKKLLSIIFMIGIFSAISCKNTNTNPDTTQKSIKEYAGNWKTALESQNEAGQYQPVPGAEATVFTINGDGSVSCMGGTFNADLVKNNGDNKYKIEISGTDLDELKKIWEQDPGFGSIAGLINAITFRFEFENETSGWVYMDITIGDNPAEGMVRGQLTRQ